MGETPMLLSSRVLLEIAVADKSIESLWLDEAERRYRAYKQGKTKAKPAAQVFREIRAKFRRKPTSS